MSIFDSDIFDPNIFDVGVPPPPPPPTEAVTFGQPVPTPKFPIYLITLIRDYLKIKVKKVN